MLSYAATRGKPDSPGTTPILNLRFKSMVGNGIPEIHLFAPGASFPTGPDFQQASAWTPGAAS